MDKRVAPTIILILLVFFILVQGGVIVFVLTKEGLGLFWNLILILIPLVIIAALIAVYIERIKEIDAEEKEDLSNF
jgi:hypothetical protein